MTCSKRTENKENVRPPNTLDRAVSTDQEVSSPHQNFTDAVEAGDRPRFLSRPHASGSGSDGRGASGSGGDGRASAQASAFSPQESISEGYSFSRFRQPLQDISNMENHEIGGSQNPHRVGPQRQLTTAPTYQRSFGFDPSYSRARLLLDENFWSPLLEALSDSLHGSDNEDEHETDAHDGEADSSGEAGDEEINDSVFEDGIRHYPFNAGTSARRERLNAES